MGPALPVAAWTAHGEPDAIPRWGDRRRTRVGLLGGSFNPAHAGHRHIAQLARQRLRLDQVWMLVSPGNPLKPSRGMAPLADRLASARGIADGRRVVATAVEAGLHTRYTFDTLVMLRRLFPRVRFVWIMGADNLVQLPRWQRWMGIAGLMPMAVMPRPTYNARALASQAAHRLRRALLPSRAGRALAGQMPPAWTFLPARQNPASATALRAAPAGHWPPASARSASAVPDDVVSPDRDGLAPAVSGGFLSEVSSGSHPAAKPAIPHAAAWTDAPTGAWT